MNRSQPSAQIPAERRSAQAELNRLITTHASKFRPLVSTVRKSLQKRLPTAHEVVYEYRDCFVISYSPSGKGYEGVLALRGGADGVKLYFNQGKDLPDPAKRLQGSGNQARWILLTHASTLENPQVADLITAALSSNRVPFAKSGQGPLTIRSPSSPRPTQRKSQPKSQPQQRKLNATKVPEKKQPQQNKKRKKSEALTSGTKPRLSKSPSAKSTSARPRR